MVRNLSRHKVLWIMNALFSLFVALIGVLNPDIYSKVIGKDFLPGAVAQDFVTLIASVVLLFFSIRIEQTEYRKQIIMFGILGYLFYAYGIYAIERVYNILYFIYLTIFGLSFYSLVYGVANIRHELLQKLKLPDPIRKVSVGYSLFIALFFSLLWIGLLLPLVQNGRKIEFAYSVFILDLCFIMPAFVILAIMAVKKRGLAFLLTPALYVLGFTLLLPVGLAELIKPSYNLSIDPTGAGLYLGISAIFLIVATVYLRNLNLADRLN